MPVPRDSQCPKRGPGLNHTVDGDIVCLHCGQMTTRSVYDMIREVREGLRRQAEPEPDKAEDPKDMPPADSPKQGICGWGRAHMADVVYAFPRQHINICRRHLAQALNEFYRRGDWMR